MDKEDKQIFNESSLPKNSNAQYNVPVQQLCHCSWSDCAGKVLIALGVFVLVLIILMYFSISKAVRYTVDYVSGSIAEIDVPGINMDGPFADLPPIQLE